MPRLFVAIDLPKTCIDQFISLQPPPMQGLRLTDPSQMHLTVHFLGEADTQRMQTALRSVTQQSFLITFAGVGYFPAAEGGLIAWVGVQNSEDLTRLHAAMSEVLVPEGYQPESRPFKPHMTLARCKRGVSTNLVKKHLAANADFLLLDQPVTTFGLYSSTFNGQKHVYRCEEQYPLVLHKNGV